MWRYIRLYPTFHIGDLVTWSQFGTNTTLGGVILRKHELLDDSYVVVPTAVSAKMIQLSIRGTVLVRGIYMRLERSAEDNTLINLIRGHDDIKLDPYTIVEAR